MTAPDPVSAGLRGLSKHVLVAILPTVAAVSWLAASHLVRAAEPATPSAVVAGAVAILPFALLLALAGAALLQTTLRQTTLRQTTLRQTTLTQTTLTQTTLTQTTLRQGAGTQLGGRLMIAVSIPAAAMAAALAEQARLVVAHAPLAPGGAVLDDALAALFVASLVAVPTSWAACGCPRPFRSIGSRSGVAPSRGVRPGRLFLTAGIATVLGCSGVASSVAVTVPTLSPSSSACLDGGPVDRAFDVTALDVDVTINRFGDHDPKGKMYAPTDRLPAVRAQAASHKVSVGLRDDPLQPLVIRANEGDCVEVRYANTATGGDFGMHIDGLEFRATSSGDSIGTNATSSVPQGHSATYRFAIPLDASLEGGHYIHPGPGYRAAVDHGLFGALVVEPPGSTYWNASTPGQALESGWEAIIKPAGVDVACAPVPHVDTCGFREAALLHHEIGNDNELLKNKAGANIPLVDNTTGTYRPGAFALNYRSETFRNRLLAFPKEKAHAYSSFTFGELATPMMRGYLGDPTKIRLMHVGAEKFHVFHLHGGGDRWRFNPLADTTFDYAATGLQKDPATVESPSNRLDSQSIGPGESYNLEIEGGAGGVQQSAGDFLLHCHIAKHYNAGMWGLWRVYDTLQPDLVRLTDRAAPPTAVDSRGLRAGPSTARH